MEILYNFNCEINLVFVFICRVQYVNMAKLRALYSYPAKNTEFVSQARGSQFSVMSYQACDFLFEKNEIIS